MCEIDSFGEYTELLSTEAAGAHGDVKSLIVGPFHQALYARLWGCHSGNGGGDHSEAWLKLIVDGEVVEQSSDKSFHSYDLKVQHDIYLDAGGTFTASVTGGNSGANTTRLYIEGRRRKF